MNYNSLRYTQGRILQICSILFILPIVVSFFYRETTSALKSFGLVAVILFALGSLMVIKKPKNLRLRISEGMVITFLTWLILSLASALAFVLAGDITSFVDAFFESASGFSTTGSTIMDDIEAMSHFSVFWRSFTHFVGGMGVLVFAFIINADATADSVNIMKAEMPGPSFGKLAARLRKTAIILYVIYFVMTLITLIMLWIGGMSFFDSLIHAMGTAGTGGFSNRNAGVAVYDSSYINWVLTIAMLLFSINFQLHFITLRRGIKEAFKSEELRWFLGLYVGFSLITFATILPQSPSAGYAFEHSFFTVSSLMSTTGYSTADFALWPLFTQLILLLVMMIGASAGSTGGGFKVSRFVVCLKSARAQVVKTRQPRQLMTVRMDGEIIPEKTRQSVLSYLCIYFSFLVVGTLIVSIDSPDFMTAFSATTSALNNIGPGMNAVGPSSNFAAFNNFTKVILSFIMLAGRLELLPFILFFTPKTWRRS